MHMEPPRIPMIKNNRNNNLDKVVVKINFHRDPTSEKLDIYKFKMGLLEKGNPEAFFS